MIEGPSSISFDSVLNYEDDNEALKAALGQSWKTFAVDPCIIEGESLENELKRLQALKSSGILNLDRKVQLERMNSLATKVFNVPVSIVSIVDLGRLWLPSNRGFGDVIEISRKSTICSFALQSVEDIFMIMDTHQDPRFKDNRFVVGPPHVRFYAAAPLISSDGYKLGVFAIIDDKPHADALSSAEKETLLDMAALVMAELESASRFQKNVEHVKKKMVASTAHDLITPLSAIQLNINLLSNDRSLIEAMNESQRIIFHQTKECVDVLSDICHQALLSYRETLVGKSSEVIKTSSHQSDLVDMTKLVSSLKYVIDSYPKHVPLKISVDNNVPHFIHGNVVGLLRSSINLLTNACKVTESGFIDFHIFIKDHRSLTFECTDTGPGIGIEDHSRLFSADGGMILCQKSKVGGTGLGLSSVAELMANDGGQFGYLPRNDITGSGSTFWFSVPIDKVIREEDDDDEQNGNKLAVLEETNITNTKLSGFKRRQSLLNDERESKAAPIDEDDSILCDTCLPPIDAVYSSKNEPICLLVEDSVSLSKAMKRCIQKQKWRVCLARDGEAALDMLKLRLWDAIFMDDQLPKLSGTECVAKFRVWEKENRKDRQMNVFLCSADSICMNDSSGFDAVLRKPIQWTYLIEILDKCCSRSTE